MKLKWRNVIFALALACVGSTGVVALLGYYYPAYMFLSASLVFAIAWFGMWPRRTKTLVPTTLITVYFKDGDQTAWEDVGAVWRDKHVLTFVAHNPPRNVTYMVHALKGYCTKKVLR